MRKYRAYIFVALFTFVVGITITGFWLSNRQRSSETIIAAKSAPPPASMPLQFSWSYESREVGSHSDGYVASDGAKIARDCESHSSVVRANRMLESKIKGAIQIIERTLVSDGKGNRIGERVVALFTSKTSNNQEAAIAWTNGDMLCSISAPSVRHVLEFENWVGRK